MSGRTCIALLTLVGVLVWLASCEEEGPYEPYRPVGTGQSPRIESISLRPSSTWVTGRVELTCHASDPDGDSLYYRWNCLEGSIITSSTASIIVWQAPNQQGEFEVSIKVMDGHNNSDSSAVSILVSGSPP